MRAAVIPSALAVASLSVSVGCGTVQPTAQPAETEATTARFSDVTEWGEADGGDEVINGAFDWATGEGWSKSRYRDGPMGTLIQIGPDCFYRDAGEVWKHWRAEDDEPLCSDEFQPPPELLARLRSHGTLESEGEEEVRGAKTTHYRVVPKDEYSDDSEQWPDVWLDTEDVLYKLSWPLGEASPRTREYFDFGVQVEVKPPCRLAEQKGELPLCEEETY
jgi:hypothetical protein